MKKRILLDNGKFATFKGKRELHKSKTIEQKIAERKDVETVAMKHGFDASNPAEGGLSIADIAQLKSGEMSLAAVISLANNRKIELPEGMEDKNEIINHMIGELSAPPAAVAPLTGKQDDEPGKALAKMSIPEMRAYAKAKEIKIPGTVKKKTDMCAFLEGSSPVVDPALDDL